LIDRDRLVGQSFPRGPVLYRLRCPICRSVVTITDDREAALWP
jgi:hypothetical protein